MIQDKEFYYETICTLYVWMTSCIMDNSFCQGIFDWTQKKLHGNTLINLVLICVVSCRGQVDAIQFWSLVLATGTWLLLKTCLLRRSLVLLVTLAMYTACCPLCVRLCWFTMRDFFNPWPISGLVPLASGLDISGGLSNVFFLSLAGQIWPYLSWLTPTPPGSCP